MGFQCFRKKESDPPVCGLHNVPLVEIVVSIDQNAPNLGTVDCYVCPVSNTVIRDLEELKPPV
jgi:hypothetical protein